MLRCVVVVLWWFLFFQKWLGVNNYWRSWFMDCSNAANCSFECSCHDGHVNWNVSKKKGFSVFPIVLDQSLFSVKWLIRWFAVNEVFIYLVYFGIIYVKKIFHSFSPRSLSMILNRSVGLLYWTFCVGVPWMLPNPT